MDTEQEAKSAPLMDPIEEPANIVQAVGTEKKKIFFFGQPGCLKHSPIKANPSENHNNHNKAAESSNAADGVDKPKPEQESVETNSDDDGVSLLQKISEALDDGEPTKTSSSENDVAPPTSNIELSRPTSQLTISFSIFSWNYLIIEIRRNP